MRVNMHLQIVFFKYKLRADYIQKHSFSNTHGLGLNEQAYIFEHKIIELSMDENGYKNK